MPPDHGARGPKLGKTSAPRACRLAPLASRLPLRIASAEREDPDSRYNRDMIGRPGEEIASVLHGQVELLIKNECRELVGAAAPAW